MSTTMTEDIALHVVDTIMEGLDVALKHQRLRNLLLPHTAHQVLTDLWEVVGLSNVHPETNDSSLCPPSEPLPTASDAWIRGFVPTKTTKRVQTSQGAGR